MPQARTTAKDLALRVIADQPDDSTLDELVRELLFHQLVREGVADHDAGRTLTHQDLKREVEGRFKSSCPRRRNAGSAASATTSPRMTRRRRSA
jgi:hypothetical protein